jgi:WXG100 family type VII secretion target
MEEAQREFAEQAQIINDVISSLQRAYAPLRNGMWEGEAANRFFEMMEGKIFPDLQKVQQYMEQSSDHSRNTTGKITEMFERIMAKVNAAPKFS